MYVKLLHELADANNDAIRFGDGEKPFTVRMRLVNVVRRCVMMSRTRISQFRTGAANVCFAYMRRPELLNIRFQHFLLFDQILLTS